MKLKNILVSGILGGIAIFVVWLIAGILVQVSGLYNVMTLGGMRSASDPVMLLFFLHPWVISFAMAIVYSQVGKAFEGTLMQKGIKFGLLAWLVSSIPSTFIVYTSMNYPLAFSVVSLAASFVYMALAGVVVAKFG